MAYSHNPYSLCYNPLTDTMELFPDAKWINVLILNHTRTMVANLSLVEEDEHTVSATFATYGVVKPGFYVAKFNLVFMDGERIEWEPKLSVFLWIAEDYTVAKFLIYNGDLGPDYHLKTISASQDAIRFVFADDLPGGKIKTLRVAQVNLQNLDYSPDQK